QGDRIAPGAVVAWLEVPDLDSRLERARAAARESQAKLRLLQVGPRPEEVYEQRQRIARARAWHDRARQDLARLTRALREDLTRLDKQVAAQTAELERARQALEQTSLLTRQAAVSDDEVKDAKLKCDVCQARLDQARAERRSRQTRGTL